MAAKLLQTLADDNPDLQKQIGCMTGIFQLFDRNHVLASRRFSQRRLPAGDSIFTEGHSERQTFDIYYRQRSADINSSKTSNEKQRISTESSRTSFSSSCSSSISSIDYGQTTQEASSMNRVIFPDNPLTDSVINQPSSALQLRRRSLDLRDVVKDSMYRESKGLPVKMTTKHESLDQIARHEDSVRPFPLSMSLDESIAIISKGKQIVPVEIKGSVRVRQAPWYHDESRECPGSSSYEAEDGYWCKDSKDARRFSYDGREINRLSVESHDTIKSTLKPKELPRLSLDSWEILSRGSNRDSRSNYLHRDPQSVVNVNENFCDSQQSAGTQKRPPSVVAKLMGLEALPDSTSTSSCHSDLTKSHPVQPRESYTRPSTVNNLSKPIRIPKSPRSSLKEPTSPRWRNSDLVMKPIPKSPIELAPWKQADGNRGSQIQASRPTKFAAKTPSSFPSVYSEIEKRLKDLEFMQSGKDLRALKQILEAIQAKGLLDTKKEEQDSNFDAQIDNEPSCGSPGQKTRLVRQRNQQRGHVKSSIHSDSGSFRTYESPIVIMKPTKLVQGSGIPTSSVIPVDGLPSLRRISNGGSVDNRKGSGSIQKAKNNRDLACNSSDKKTGVKNTRLVQSAPRPQQLPKESTGSSMKSLGSVSPRLQHKKLDLEQRSRPPTPPSDAYKPKRESNRQMTESSSPARRQRLKSHKLPQSDDQLSQISNESRTSSLQGDDVSVQSDCTTILEVKMDVEVNNAEQPNELSSIQNLPTKATNYSLPCLVDESPTSTLEAGVLEDIAAVAPEHPSPVSVLDVSVYRDDSPSPVKQTPSMLIAGCSQDPDDQNEVKWYPLDTPLSDKRSSLTSRKKLENVENLVKKLERLNSTHDEARTDYIASLCDTNNPDHRYISEMLLASGLLLRDLGSGLSTLQLHPSGHPISPELFFVLEQTKGSSVLSKDETDQGKTSNQKTSSEKIHRKVMFDVVNEILIKKLPFSGPSAEPMLKSNKLATNTPTAQKLLKELCQEIGQLQVRKPECSSLQEDDGLRSILWDDVMTRSESWTDFHNELSGLGLEVERSIFKELVNEVVVGEVAALRAKMGRRRKLFAK